MPGSSTSQPFIFDSAGDSRRGPVGRSFSGQPSPGNPSSGNPSPGNPALGNSDPLLQQTKREIAQMLRELAAAARDEIPAEKFTSILCDRTLRAMSAEGVVIWEPHSNESSENPNIIFRPLARLGRVTDRSITQSDIQQANVDASASSADRSSSAAWSAHQCLLATIAADGEPAVVPSTPDVTEPNVPANPTPVPAALVPIDCPGRLVSSHSASNHSASNCSANNGAASSLVIEVFLEPDGGIATQRGYLRFVCQVADLAGEYFRSEQIRTLLSQQTLAEKCDRLIAKIHELDRSEKIAAALVDELAEIFQLDRVAVSLIGPKTKSRIIAVSHVESIDHHSESAEQIRAVSSTELGPSGAVWMSTEDKAVSENLEVAAAANIDPLFSVSGIDSYSKQADHGYRLTGFRRADKSSLTLREFEKRELQRTVRQAIRSIQHVEWSRRSIWVRWGHRRPNAGQSTSGTNVLHRAKRFAFFAMIAAVIALVMIIPVPKTIEASATLRAQDTQRICAVVDAVVETIQVEHGQSVRAGDVLMTLSDSSLEKQITSLVGRGAVLAEQKVRLTEDMVDSSASDFDSYEKIQGQRSVVDEEIASVNQQLALLHESKAALTIRSDRDGVVDAWQIAKRLRGRPVSRGDDLLQVISHDSAWLIDAEVSQARIGRVRRADQENRLSARVTLDDAPGISCIANRWQFGPTRSVGSATNAADVKTAVTLSLGTVLTSEENKKTTMGVGRTNQALQTDAKNRLAEGMAARIGAPAHVYFHCGSVPLGDLLAGDLYRDIRSHLALHWRFSDWGFSDIEGSQSF